MDKVAAPKWVKLWESLSPASRARIAGSMEPGQLRTLVGTGTKGLLGSGSYNNAWGVAGRLPTGQAGEFVRKLPVAGGKAMTEMYPAMMQSSQELNQLFPGRFAQYHHYDPQKGIYQDFVRGRAIPDAMEQTSAWPHLTSRYFPGAAEHGISDLRPANMKLVRNTATGLESPVAIDYQHRIGDKVVGKSNEMPLMAGRELPWFRRQLGGWSKPELKGPHPNLQYVSDNFASIADDAGPKGAIRALFPRYGERYTGTPIQQAQASARYWLAPETRLTSPDVIKSRFDRFVSQPASKLNAPSPTSLPSSLLPTPTPPVP